MTDKASKPTQQQIERLIGQPGKEAWLEMRRFIEDSYDVAAEMEYGWAKYG